MKKLFINLLTFLSFGLVILGIDSCKPNYQKRIDRFLASDAMQGKELISKSNPATEYNHFVIYKADGAFYMRQFDRQKDRRVSLTTIMRVQDLTAYVKSYGDIIIDSEGNETKTISDVLSIYDADSLEVIGEDNYNKILLREKKDPQQGVLVSFTDYSLYKFGKNCSLADVSTFGGKFKVNATCHLDNYFNKEDLGNGYSDYFSFNPNIGNFSISLHSDLNLQTTAEQRDSLKFDFYSFYFNPVYPATILKDKAQLTQVVRQICNYDMAKEFQPTNTYAAEDGLVTFDDFRSNDNNSVDRTFPRKKFYFVSGTANSIEYADYSRYRFKVTGGFFDDIEIYTDDSKFTSIDYPAKIYFCGYYDVKPNLYGFINSLFGDSGDDSDKIRFYGADLLMAEQQDTLKSFLFDGMACLADLLPFGTEHNVMPHGAR